AEKGEHEARELAKAERKSRTETAESLALTTTLLAQSRWKEGNVLLANELLEQVPPEFRFGTWRYFKRQFEGSYATLYGHTGYVSSVAFNPRQPVLASASWDRTIKLWDISTGAELRTLRGHSSRVQGLAFSPDGSVLASASADQTIKLWNTSSGMIMGTLCGH